jgi:hypothetical protein
MLVVFTLALRLSSSPQNTIYGAQVTGNLLAHRNASPLEIGGTASQGCVENTIGGHLTVDNIVIAIAKVSRNPKKS